MPVPPPTAYQPGKKLTVGSHAVEIVKFIGEGGFAHVYTVIAHPPIPGQDVTCLKRVQVPNKAYLNLLRAEVDAMQRLKGCSNIVQYFDSHAERMHDSAGQYEVFLLMEFCEQGGLIDFMNTRLRDQLREHEILKIMYDITLGLAHMHYLQPPLLHRDLKIENVLITGDGTFKLCDFGSVSPVLRPPKNPQEFHILEEDIQHHTTVQYRSPEMIDIRSGHPIDEKSDIWALGVFLYKLCFYSTPFERPNQTLDQFQKLILSVSYTIPPRPAYSERLKNMIRVLLQQDPRMRPNVFQVMQEICDMRRLECPLRDIYSGHQLAMLPVTSSMNPSTAGMPSSSIPLLNQGMPAMVSQPDLSSQTAVVTSVIPSSSNSSVAIVPSTVPASTNAPPPPARPSVISSHQPNTSNCRPNFNQIPGSAPISSIVATSPHQPSLSPTRSVSPLNEVELSSRYPSLQDMDKSDHTNNWPDFNDDSHTSNRGKSPAHERNSSVSAEAAKLKQILTGISGKSNTVILQSPQDSSLSSIDFLKTLKPAENQYLKKHRRTSVPIFHQKANSQKFDNEKYESLYDDDDGEAYHPLELKSDFQIPSRNNTLKISDSDSFSDSVEDTVRAVKAKPSKPVKPIKPMGTKPPIQPVNSNSNDVGKPLSQPSFSSDMTAVLQPTHISKKPPKPVKPTIQKLSQSSTSPTSSPKARPQSVHLGTSVISSGDEQDPFIPSNTIQQRVHSFLNSHDIQHPTRRTARGYGRYTDAAHNDNVNSNGAEKYLKPESTSEELTSPPVPPRALKPKLK